MALEIITAYCKNFKRYGTKRAGEFDSIEMHTIGCAQNTAEKIRNNMDQYSPGGIVHAICDAEVAGKVLVLLPDDNVAWADAGYGNNHSYTIEVAESDYMKYKPNSASYSVTDAAKFEADIRRGYATAVQFVAMKCAEFGFTPQKKLKNGLHQVYSHQEANALGLASEHVDPTHVWDRFGLTMDQFRADVAAAMTGSYKPAHEGEIRWYRVRISWDRPETQRGAYEHLENAVRECPAGYRVYDADGQMQYAAPEASGTQSSAFAGLTEAQAAEKLLEACRPIAQEYGLLPSVSAAQSILESGYGYGTELSHYNNMCGMKCMLSGNTWPGSTWDGVSSVKIRTAEQDPDGRVYYVLADFRVYPCVEDSVADRCAYLTGARDGDGLRYAGIREAADYRAQVTIIKEGGYATDTRYIDKICDIIERYGLDKYDRTAAPGSTEGIPAGGTGNAPSSPAVPYMVRTTINSLVIRRGPGRKYKACGSINEKKGHKNTYTIVEVSKGGNWGRLKSGAGWIPIRYTKAV